jgi:pimeloyl-ACP methyl ester carboxylesterase
MVLVDQSPDEGQNGVTLAHDHIAPTLVLLPGLDGTGILFRQFAKVLEASFDTQIVAYPADRPLGYAELEALVREAVPRDRPFVVLGESFSGPIAIRLGAGRPPAGQVVARLPTAVPPPGMVGLILCVTFAKNPYPSLSWAGALARSLPLDALPGWVKGPFLWGPSSKERDRLESELATAVVGHDVLRHRVASVLAVDETTSLALVRMPTLVLHASDDRVVPRAATEHIMRTAPHAELVEIPGPHMLLQIRAAECAAAVVRFMQGLQAAGDVAWRSRRSSNN